MNIENFEVYINKIILNRGLEYYKDGHVESLRFNGNKWTADVVGTDFYEVTVKMDDSGNILSSCCDCPYDLGEYCKHEAAVFYAIANELKKTSLPKKIENIKAQQLSLEELLKTQSKETLVALLLDYADQNDQIKDDILLRFSANKEESIKHAKNLVRASINSVMHRGYVEYSDTRKSTEGAKNVLHMAEETLHDSLLCVTLCLIVLDEMLKLQNSCDDSNGYVGAVISDAIKLIDNVVISLPENHLDYDKIFDLIFSHASQKNYIGDCHQDILNACIPMCQKPHLRKQFENYLLSLQIKAGNRFHDKYVLEKSQNILLQIIDTYDGSEAAYLYMEENIDNYNFCKTVIQRAIEENRLDHALSLCFSGESTNAEYPGITAELRRLRYSIYEKLKDIESLRELAMDFTIDGNFEYFLKLKELYTTDEWLTKRESLLKTLRSDQRNSNIYKQILIHENLKEPLLAYCKESPYSVTELYSHLLPDFSEDVEMIFVDYIKQEAKKASSRKHYQEVCNIIRHFKKAYGTEKSDSIKFTLLKTHSRQPAFVDELKNLK